MTQQSTANSAHQRWFGFFSSGIRSLEVKVYHTNPPLTYSWSLGETGAIKDCLERLNEPLCWWFQGIVFLLSLASPSSAWERFSWSLSRPYNEPVMSQLSQNLNLNIRTLCRNHEKNVCGPHVCVHSPIWNFCTRLSSLPLYSWQESDWVS